MTTAAEDKKTAAKTTSDGPTAAGEERGKRAGREKKSPTRDYVRLPSLAPPEQHKDASPAYSRVNHPSPATPRLLFPLHLLFPKPVLCVDFRESGSLGCHRTRAEVYTGGIDDDDDDYGDGSTGRGPGSNARLFLITARPYSSRHVSPGSRRSRGARNRPLGGGDQVRRFFV